MTSHAGLDVSQQESQICILDATGIIRWCGPVAHALEHAEAAAREGVTVEIREYAVA